MTLPLLGYSLRLYQKGHTKHPSSWVNSVMGGNGPCSAHMEPRLAWAEFLFVVEFRLEFPRAVSDSCGGLYPVFASQS